MMEMPRTDVPLAVLIFVLAVWAVTGALCLLNWYRRRGTGVAFLELLRFTTMGLILFTLCKPEYDRELPREEALLLLLLQPALGLPQFLLLLRQRHLWSF